MTPNQTSKKTNEKDVYYNLQDRRVRQQPIYKVGQLVGSDDIKRSSVKVIHQIGQINYIKLTKSYTALFLAIESTVCLRDITRF